MPEYRPVLIVDHRENRSSRTAELERIGCKVINRELEVGDDVIADGVVAEVKAPEDFISSVIGIEKGKLFRQIADCAKFYEHVYLLIEGRMPDLFSHAGVNPNAVWGWLETCQAHGAMIRYTVNPTGTAQTLKFLATKYQEPEAFGKFFCHHGYKARLSHRQRAERLCEWLPGVGDKLAFELIEHFGSVEGVMLASRKELMQVDGISTIISRDIRDAVTPKKVTPCFI
jgi:ERCC4-type nuclease